MAILDTQFLSYTALYYSIHSQQESLLFISLLAICTVLLFTAMKLCTVSFTALLLYSLYWSSVLFVLIFTDYPIIVSVTLVLIETTREAVLMPHLWLSLHTLVCWPGMSPLQAVDPLHLVTGVTQGCHHGPTWSQGQAGLPVSVTSIV